MIVSVFTDSGCVDFDNVVSCGVCKHCDKAGRYKRFLVVEWIDKEHDVNLTKSFLLSSVSEFWCDGVLFERS